MLRLSTAVILVLATFQISQGTITDFKQLQIDFSNAADAKAKATWSPVEHLNIGPDGLGWDGDAATLRDGRIRTRPLALGMTWRAPYVASVRLALRPEPTPIKLNSGQTSVPFPGTAYVRYSPDLKHWSTWQVLARTEASLPHEKDQPGRYFLAPIQVPQLIREQYDNLLTDYSSSRCLGKATRKLPFAGF